MKIPRLLRRAVGAWGRRIRAEERRRCIAAIRQCMARREDSLFAMAAHEATAQDAIEVLEEMED